MRLLPSLAAAPPALALLAPLALLGGCSGSARDARAGALTLVRVVGRPLLTNAALYIALDEGYFARHGLRVEFVEMPESSGQAVPALARGRVDVLAGSLGAGLLNAIAQGAPIRAVADKGRDPTTCAGRALVARRSLAERERLDSPARFRGRRIVLNPMSTGGYIVDSVLSTAGLSLDDVTVLNLPVTSLRDALDNGAVDLVLVTEPWTSRLRQAGHEPIPYTIEVDRGFQQGLLVYGPSLLRDRPEVGRQFMLAYLEGVRQYNEGKTVRNVALLAARTGLDAETLRVMCWPSVAADGLPNTPTILAFERWALRRGHLLRVVGEAEFWEPSFVAHATRVLPAPVARALR